MMTMICDSTIPVRSQILEVQSSASGSRHGEPGGGANSGGAEKPGDVSCLVPLESGMPLGTARKPWENNRLKKELARISWDF